MNTPFDTICAPATAPGTGALAIIRISGPDTFGAVSSLFTQHTKLEPRRAVHGTISHNGRDIDDTVVIYFKGPASFTGEDSAEITCHGNPLIVRDIVRALSDCGIRMAEPGEFTKRAFLNGRIDLTEAEAINHIICARSSWEISSAIRQMHGSLKNAINLLRDSLIIIKGDIECSIDFSTEEIEFISYDDAKTQILAIQKSVEDILRRCTIGQKVSRGIDLPIVGKPNAGKSSILNLILNSERAIVSDIPGTTRDLIKETIQFGGVHVNLIDTAGIRESESVIEKIGIERSAGVIESSSIIIMVLDAITGITDEDRDVIAKLDGKHAIFVINKTDAASSEVILLIEKELSIEAIPFSAITGNGLESLEKEVTRLIADEFTSSDDFFVADERIIHHLTESSALCENAVLNLNARDPHEIIAFTLQSLIESLSGITGEISPDDVLDSVFSRFCIGK